MTDLTPDPSVVAAEYALGLMSPDEAAAAEARLARDPDFRREVDCWQERLAGLAEEVVPVRPPPAAWDVLSGKIAKLAPLARRSAPPQGAVRLRWLAAGLVVGVGLGAAAARVFPSVVPKPGTPVASSTAPAKDMGSAVAVLYPETGAARFVVTARLSEGRLFVVPTAPWNTDAGIPCLWGVIGDADPVFVTTVSTQQPAEIVLPEALLKLAKAGVVFVITAEAPDWDARSGSQGSIVAHGKLEIAAAPASPSL